MAKNKGGGFGFTNFLWFVVGALAGVVATLAVLLFVDPPRRATAPAKAETAPARTATAPAPDKAKVKAAPAAAPKAPAQADGGAPAAPVPVPPPKTEPSPEDQIAEDAAAVGMTSRAAPDEAR